MHIVRAQRVTPCLKATITKKSLDDFSSIALKMAVTR